MGVGWLPGFRAELAALAARENLIDAIALNLPGLPFSDGADAAGWTTALLSAYHNAEPGTYLVVTHPARHTPETEKFYADGGTPGQVAAEREREFQALISPAFLMGSIRYDEIGM